MGWERIENNWDQFKLRLRERWARLTPEEIDRLEGQRDRLLGRLEDVYGLPRTEAEQQIQDFEQNADAGRGWDQPGVARRRTDD